MKKQFPVKNKEKMQTFSAVHLKFLRRKKREQYIIVCARLGILILIVIGWELAARTGAVNDFIFSSPSRMWAYLVGNLSGTGIIYHTLVTLAETIVSFLLVTLLSLLIAMFLWASPLMERILEPYLVVLNSLPKSALAPVLIVWMGNNGKTIILTGVLIAVFSSSITLAASFRETDPDKARLIYSMGGDRRDVLKKVMVPGSVPVLVSTMKVNIGLCLVGVIIGEFLTAKAGLGYLIIYGSQVFKMDMVMLSIIILCILSALLYQGIALLEKRFAWRY